MNEETIIEKRPTANGQQETKKEGSAWKHVTLGTKKSLKKLLKRSQKTLWHLSKAKRVILWRMA